MEEEYLNLGLTSKIIKTVVEEVIKPEIVHDNIKMREKLKRASALIQNLDRGNIDFCNKCYDILTKYKNRRLCDGCGEWDCQRCISTGELSPIHHICVRCGKSFCVSCIEGMGTPDICITCKEYYCEVCYERHNGNHP